MMYLYVILVPLTLLLAFFLLTSYESRRGIRLLEGIRSRFDTKIERIEFIFQHVDFAAFLRDEVRRIAQQLGHDAVHLTLRAVRATERLLTRIVRDLRANQPMNTARLPRESAREFVRTLSDFKGQLEVTRPMREGALGESTRA